MNCTIALKATVISAALLLPAAVAEDAPVSFNWDIRPIFAENCYTCHGPDAQERKAGLRFDERASLFDEERKSGPVIDLEDPRASELIDRLTTEDEGDRMPPPEHGPALSQAEIDTLVQWIEQGAEYQRHWSLVRPQRPAVPDVAEADWPVNEIDSFVLARLEDDGIAPSPEADRRTLIRRAYLDLIGLPPSRAQVDAFLADTEPGAYERVVDELLDSPHFGERWARHWLDGARYADSNGYSIDSPRSIWPYRDWVIDAYNDNKPFDEFTVEQIAGDMLPDATVDQRVATGFHRNTMINEEGGVDKEEFRVKAVMDRVMTTGQVFFGLTLGCAQCHTHKYDPIEQEEFYGMFAFFNNDDYSDVVVSPDEIVEKRRELDRKANDLERDLKKHIEAQLAEWANEPESNQPEEIRAELAIAPDDRDTEIVKKLREYVEKSDVQAKEKRAAIDAIRASRPELDKSMVLRARSERRETPFLEQGDYTRPSHNVKPHVPAALHPMPDDAGETRLDLARWIVDSENPLTARVTVNRIWQYLFGRGIVETDNDFGTQGSRPTHPQLLDWLAVEFVERGWDTKSIVRTIATSATYRQSSNVRPELDSIDPDNRMLARQSRVRLDAEIIRDSGLTVSGLLDRTIGGPGVYPPQPDGVMKLGQRARPWNVSEGGDRYRRGMYTYFWRATPHPSLMVFDAPTATTACTRRTRSNTPLQALTLLNDAAFYEMAGALAERMASQDAASDADRIDTAFEWCFARTPSESERAILAELIANADGPARWATVARAMLNLDEFITRE